MDSAPANLRVVDVQVRTVMPDGSTFYIGRPAYKHENPLIDMTRGVFERWRFERNTRRFNAIVARHLETLKH